MNEIETVNAEFIEKRTIARAGLKLLINELTLQRKHLVLLTDQNSALLRADRKSFTALQPHYAALLCELSAQHKVRTAYFAARRVIDHIQEWPAPEQANARKVCADLNRVLSEVRQLNARNRVLINSQMKYIDFMLDLLVKTHRRGSLYGPQGHNSVNRGNLFFNRAA